MTLFDAFYTGHTQGRSPDEITRCLRESVADLMAAANDPNRPRRPLTHAELEADGATKIRGGKSRRALARERRPVRPIHRDNAVSYNGGRTWEADGGDR